MSTPEPISKLLKDYLDELNDAELETFQWYMVLNERDGCKPIAKAQAKKATREQTVDKLIQAYREDGAGEVTVDIFFRMSQNDLGLRLSGAIASRHEEQRPRERLPIVVDLLALQSHCCVVCLEVFTDPVMLQCGHSFCKTCVSKCREISSRCPLCKRALPDAEPPINFALKNLIENVKREREQADPPGRQGDDSQSFQVKEKRKAFKKLKKFCDSSVEYIKSQSQDAEKKIKVDLEKLHLFLKEEEAARIAAVREEETQKIALMQTIAELSRDTFSLSDTLKAIQDMGADNSFIQKFKTKMERTQSSLPDPQQLPQALMDMPKHVGNLQFKVWERMISIIKHTPVVLDPNTASPWFSMSDDLTTVKVTDAKQQRPRNLERNTSCTQVLGSEGFSSGKHCWEVVVGNKSRWILGVAEETMGRKKELWSAPQNGLWTVTRSKTDYKDASGNTLTLQARPKRIRIELDYEKGKVSFHDAEKNTLIFIYEDTFTQKLHPYFAFVEIDDKDDVNVDDDDDVEEMVAEDEDDADSSGAGSSGNGIRICESKVSVTWT